MKMFTNGVTVALTALALAAPQVVDSQARAAAPQVTSAVPVTKTTIAGIPVIHKRVTANDVIAVQVYLKGGSAALTTATAGIENLLGATFTKGSAKYDKDKFAALSTVTGTSIGSTVNFDFTTFTLQGVRQNWAQAWDLFAEAMLHPTFPAEEIAQARDQIVNDLKQHADDPDTFLDELSDSAMYAGHAYAVEADGTPESMAKLTRDDVVKWHKARLTKANLVIVVVGNASPVDLRAKITAAFGSLPATGGEPKRLAAVASAKGEPVMVKRDLPTNYIQGVFAAPAPSHADFAATRVAIMVLGDRLFEEVRTKRNLTYAVAANLSTRASNRGRLYVTAVDPDTTLKVILGEVGRMQKEPVPAQLLRETVGVFSTGYLMGQQTNMGQAGSLGLWEVSGGGYQNSVNYVNRLRAVTPAQVQRAAQAYLRNYRFTVIGDPSKVSRGVISAP